MATSADAIGLLFKIRADSKDAQDDIKKLRKTVDDETKAIETAGSTAFLKLGQSAGLSGEQMAKLKTGFTAAASAIAVVGGAAAAAGLAIFGLAKQASDAGSEIFEAGQKSNLSAEFLSVLKVQAEQSGSSFESASSKVVKWSNSLVDAARGNKELTADLKRFGIDAAEAYRNPEAALKTFIESFNKLPPSAANNEAAMRLFKDRTGELIPVLRAFGTDYEGLVRKLDASGQIWTEEGTKKADEFGDALTELGQIASGLGNTFARELMPEMTRSMKAIGDEMVRNKDLIVTTARVVSEAIGGLGEAYRQAAFAARTFIGMAAGLTPLEAAGVAARVMARSAIPATNPADFGGFGPHGTASPATTGAGDVVNEAAAKEAARKREQLRKEELRSIKAAEDAKVDALKKRIDTVKDAERDVLRELEQVKKEGIRLDKEMADARADASDAVRQTIRAEIADLTEENLHLNAINDTIRRAEILGAIDARTAAFARQLAVVNAIAESVRGTAPVGPTGEFPQGAGQASGPFVDPATFEAQFGTAPDFSPWESAVSGLKGMVVESFEAMGDAMVQAAQAAFVYGQSFGKAMKQATVAALASIASLAIVEAIKETALGFAKLAGFLPGPAALHFKAAALWGVAAVAAGAGATMIGGGGAGVAGSAFGSSDTFAGSTAERDRTIRESRRGGTSDPNQAAVMGYMMVDVKHDDGHVERQMTKVWKRMGQFRDEVMASTVGTAPSQ